jgi:SGF29 tudor-like domain
MAPVQRIWPGSWQGSSSRIKTSIGMFNDHQDPDVPLSTTCSYDVEDIEPQEDGKPLYVITIVLKFLRSSSQRRYSASLRSTPLSIIPLPDKDAPSGNPAHITAYQEFLTGATVMALYPDTSCFYRAEVIASPKDIPTQGRVGVDRPRKRPNRC